METITCIRSRRSKRLFLKKEVPQKILNQLIEAAICAPSSMNCQPWHFIIIKNQDTKIKLANLKEENNRGHILTAPVVMVVCVDTNKSPNRWIEDGVTATENLLLTAHDLGLGAVYVTGFSPSNPVVTEKIRQILSLPENMVPVTILPVGYPNPSETIEKKELSKLKEVTHLNKW